MSGVSDRDAERAELIARLREAGVSEKDLAVLDGPRPRREITHDEISRSRRRGEEATMTDRTDNATGGMSPAAALDASRIDLLALIDTGIPSREFVPGSGGTLVRGKRHHIAGGPKAGKSLTVAVVGAVHMIGAGQTVTVLDRENGADEYARRVASVLDARTGADTRLREAIKARYRYHAWPTVDLGWGHDPRYPEAFADTDVVVFDSNRKFLTSLGLKEDSSDDYSIFTEQLIDPLMQAGVTTVTLDNTPHDGDRARGSSSKADLCDVMYSLRTVKEFALDRAGRVELEVKHSRFGELTGKFALELGAGSYGHWQHQGVAEARHAFHEACEVALRVKAPQGRDPLIKAAREAGIKGTDVVLRGWLDEFVGDPASPIVHDLLGYRIRGLGE